MKDTVSRQVLTTDDAGRWRSYLPAGRSAFGSLEFALITERHAGYAARLFVFGEGEEVIAYPVFLRSVSGLPFAVGNQIHAWDTVSPEYTGPLALRDVSQTTVSRFRKCFAEYCQRERIVAEFAHLHPWNCSADLWAKEDVFLDREIVYVDLALSEEQIWGESFTYACRKNIKRALRESVRVFQATKPEDVREFYRIYTQTMDRRGALTGYYFPLSYFMAFFWDMPDNAAFFLAACKDRIAAATLYLHDDIDVYSYLGGADHALQHVRPTNVLVYEAIRWAQRHNKRRLILGGGYQPGDGIFRFKANFSPLRAKFYVYKHIHLPDQYSALSEAWAAHYSVAADLNGYFPAYRSIPSHNRANLGKPMPDNCTHTLWR